MNVYFCFRGRHLCIDKQYGDISQTEFSYADDYYVSSKPTTWLRRQPFQGVLDRGTPLIINENGRMTVLGIFKEQLPQQATIEGLPKPPDEGPALFNQLDADTVNWIMNNADWTQDSACNTFTSCMCGTEGGPNFDYDEWM